MNIPLFDGHCDTLMCLLKQGLKEGSLRKNDVLHIDLERGGLHKPYAQFFAAFATERSFPGLSGWEVFNKMYERLRRETELAADITSFCRTAAEAEKAAEQGKSASFITVEGAWLLDCSEECLEQAAEMGVKAVAITWNVPNILSGTNVNETERGLSEAGRSFVRKCQKLGVLVDVSHISDKGFWDIIDIAEAPVIASHSNARALCPHSRNLTDEQFKALAATGGTAGLNLYSLFVGEKPNIDDAVRHIEHFLELGGEKSVAIGGDLDGCDELPEGIRGVQDMHKVYEALLARNYPQTLVDDIFYNNLMRVVKNVCVM